MACRGNPWAAVICTAVIALSFRSPAQQQQQPNSVALSSTVQPAPSIDPRAEIDELIKQSAEHLNVKGQFQRAAEFAQQALDRSQKIGDKIRAANSMMYLASAYAFQGRLAEAFDISQKDVVLAREAGDKKVLEQALNTAGGVAGESGRYEEALNYFYQCLDVSREADDRTMRYMSLLNIGEAYTRSGEPDRAEAPLEESLRIAPELKGGDLHTTNRAKKATEMALLNLGAMEIERHRYLAALSYYEKVHASVPETPLWVVAALEGMANSHEHSGEPAQAIELLQQALPLAEKAASGVQSVRLLSHLGVNQEMLGDLDAALGSQYRALSAERHGGGNPDYEWQIESRIGHVLRALGRREEALEHYRNALEGIEHLRSVALNTEEGRAGVLAKSRETYAETADLLYDLDRASEALETAESGRARGFLDMLAYSRMHAPAELTPQQREREQALLVRIRGVEKELWREDLSAEEKQRRKRELAAAEQDLEAFQLAVRRENPRYASIHYPEPINVRHVQDRLLDQKTAIVEFQLGEKRSLVWAVSVDRVDTAVLPGRKDIEAQVSAYRKLLTQRASALTIGQSLSEIERRGRQLYELLLQPLAAALASRRCLIIVPDGTLAYLPFETLIAGQQPRSSAHGPAPKYLVERFAIVYAPSASSLAEIEAVHPEPARTPKMLLAFADPVVAQVSQHTFHDAVEATRPIDPDPVTSSAEEYLERGFSWTQLPSTRTEALAISRLFPESQRHVYLGSAARTENLKAERLGDYRYIHFASHAFLDESSPVRSGILFSPGARSSNTNDFLQVRDIMRLKLNADLVTLSACSTGLGKLVTGEGVLGLTRAFFYAGATNLAVSLWNVNDSATATLMSAFYRNLKRGLPKTSAMRQAKLSLLHGNDVVWRHPYYWAAFVLVGDGK